MEENKITPVINTDNTAFAPAFAKGISMQSNAHSVGLMFEQSINQQQNQFQTNLNSSLLGVKKVLEVKSKQPHVIGKRKSRFSEFE